MALMDATTQALLITTASALLGNIVMRVFEDRKRTQERIQDRLDREQDRLDRENSTKKTEAHRKVMALKMDANTAISAEAAENASAIKATTEKIEVQTNGMQAELVRLAREEGYRHGVSEGIQQERSRSNKFPA